jgi:hypothetical protein
MNRLRAFSADDNPQSRTLEDAPLGMRQELIDAFYYVAEHAYDPGHGLMNVDEELYLIVSGVLGVAPSAQPHGGKRQRMTRDVNACENWKRIYDLVMRVWPVFKRFGLQDNYRDSVNHLFAAYGVAWDLTTDGFLVRVLPGPVTTQVDAALQELSNPIYASARDLAKAGLDAFNDRPRRSRDACANMFDAMEATAKIRFGMPNATFGWVIGEIKKNRWLAPETILVMEALNGVRNKNFGHGMNQPFALSESEVDLTYLSCWAGILLFTRTS